MKMQQRMPRTLWIVLRRYKGATMQYLPFIIGPVIIVLEVFVLASKFRSKKSCKKYLEIVEKHYQEEGVRATLVQARFAFPLNSLEYITLTKGIHYLDHSILQDYKTCFHFLEQTFHEKEVKEKHEKILEIEKEKSRKLLETKGETNEG